MKTRSTIMVVLAALLIATLGLAAEGTVSTVKGQVVAVDMKTKTLTVKADGADGKEVPVQLAADTKIVKGGAPITVQDLGIGDKVTVNGKVVDGKWTAVTIGVEPKA